MKKFLGIEFGSTRIKSVLINEKGEILAQGSFEWENKLENGIWTYSLDLAKEGLVSCYKELKCDYKNKYSTTLTKVDAIGISGMMHGYLVFDKNGAQLAQFRTWRNTITEEASTILTDKFKFHVPQRWSVSHIYQAILNGEKEVNDISFATTLAGYFHYLLTNEKVIGIGEGSGMFPVDISTKNYNQTMIDSFNKLVCDKVSWKIENILPKVLCAGTNAGYLTKEGSLLLDPSGELECGIPLCPPEGDMQTGMICTNSVKPGSGNASIGTSSNITVITDKTIGVYPEIDIISTPSGANACLVHVNNGTSEINAWERLFKEIVSCFKDNVSDGDIFYAMFNSSLNGDKTSYGIYPIDYTSGETITKMNEGKLLLIREPDASLSLSNFVRSHIYSLLGTIRLGLDILIEKEHVVLKSIVGHGGFFKTPKVGQIMLSCATKVPVTTLASAGEGGPYGQAILASYMIERKENESLENYLDNVVFANQDSHTELASKEDMDGFDMFMKGYVKALNIEKQVIADFKKQ